MRKFTAVGFVVALLAAATLCRAQDPPEFPKPEKEHQWLKQMAGEWVTESKLSFGPDQPALECTGTIHSRMLGGFWVVNEMKSEMMGMQVTGIQTIGYDPARKKYVGTWVDSMTSHLWHYRGSVDQAGKILTLEAEGPNFMADGKLAKFQDIYELKSADEIAFSSRMLGEDKKWVTFMTGTAKRKK